MNTYINLWTISSLLLQLLTAIELLPVAQPDYVLVRQNEAVIVDVLQNDIDPDQLGLSGKDALIITEFTNGNKGSVAIISDDGYDKLRYTPNSDGCNDDEFTYTIQDNDDGSTAIGTVHIHMLCSPMALHVTIQDPPTTTSTSDDPYDSYATSLNDWNALKIENNDCYTYTVTTASWTGYRTSTTIQVKDGTVIRRSYEAFDARSGTVPVDSYDETDPVKLGTNAAGAAPLTMDELYLECYDDLEMAHPAATVYFSTFDGNNVLKTCGYVPDGCMDDCFRGTGLSSFEFCNDEEEEELPPIANPDLVITTMNSPVLIDVLENDTDPDQAELPGKDVLTIIQVTNGNKGSVGLMSNQLIGYTPNFNECGGDEFTYTIQDDDQSLTAVGTVGVYIECPSNADAGRWNVMK